MGIPTVFITALPTIAQMVGANRIVRGVAITHPTGDPSLAAGDELALRVRILDRAELAPEDYLSVHAGFDTTEANRDPDRLVPLDAARALVQAGRIGRIHDEFFTTTGVDTPVAVSTRMGQEIGAEIRNAGVDAVILTGT